MPHLAPRLYRFLLIMGVCFSILYWLPAAQSSEPRQSPSQLIESDAPEVNPLGNWITQSATDASAGTYLYSGNPAATLTLEFSGPTLEIIYVAGASFGTLAIEVDGTVLRTVSTTAETTAFNQRAHINYLTDENHTLRVYAAQGMIAVDAFVALPINSSDAVSGNIETVANPRVPPCQDTDPYIASVTSSGTQVAGGPFLSSMSENGRYIVFDYFNASLVANDTNTSSDIYLHDRQTCQTTLISQSVGGQVGNNASQRPSITPNGRYIVFHSGAANLVPNDTNATDDVFFYDQQIGLLSRVSIASNGEEANGRSFNASISDDGRYIVYQSRATNLVALDTTSFMDDIYLYDRQTGQTSLASVSSSGEQANGQSWIGKISGNGRFVVFYSIASNLGLNGGITHIYAHDFLTGQTEMIDVTPVGEPSNNTQSLHYNDYTMPMFSTDGRYVAFHWFGSDLVVGDTNDLDVFVRDLQTDTTIVASTGLNGVNTSLYEYFYDMSRDGRYVIWTTMEAGVPGDTNTNEDVYRRDLLTGNTIRLSLSDTGAEPDSGSYSIAGSISPNGRYVSFISQASLVSTDSNTTNVDLYVADLNNPDTLALFRTTYTAGYTAMSLISTLADLPPLSAYNNLDINSPTSGHWLMGDWNGDSLKTPGVYTSQGVFYYTNTIGSSVAWSAVWLGLQGRPAVAGRFNSSFLNDCIGAVDNANFPPYGLAFALYFTCDLTPATAPPLTFQWLSVLLPDSAGFSGVHQFVAGDWNGDGVESVAVRRDQFIAFTDIPPTTLLSEFNRAQFWGTPPVTGGDEGWFLAGNWNMDTTDSFGVFYSNGHFYRRDDLDWNSGVHILQRIGQPIGTPVIATSWRNQ